MPVCVHTIISCALPKFVWLLWFCINLRVSEQPVKCSAIVSGNSYPQTLVRVISQIYDLWALLSATGGIHNVKINNLTPFVREESALLETSWKEHFPNKLVLSLVALTGRSVESRDVEIA